METNRTHKKTKRTRKWTGLHMSKCTDTNLSSKFWRDFRSIWMRKNINKVQYFKRYKSIKSQPWCPERAERFDIRTAKTAERMLKPKQPVTWRGRWFQESKMYREDTVVMETKMQHFLWNRDGKCSIRSNQSPAVCTCTCTCASDREQHSRAAVNRRSLRRSADLFKLTRIFSEQEVNFPWHFFCLVYLSESSQTVTKLLKVTTLGL